MFFQRFINYNDLTEETYNHGISIVFDDAVVVTRYLLYHISIGLICEEANTFFPRSNLVVDEVTLLTRLGSLVGVGRTLLWILLAIIGASKSLAALVPFFKAKVKPKEAKIQTKY